MNITEKYKLVHKYLNELIKEPSIKHITTNSEEIECLNEATDLYKKLDELRTNYIAYKYVAEASKEDLDMFLRINGLYIQL